MSTRDDLWNMAYGGVVLECARCLAGDAQDSERPYRAYTIAKGAAYCPRHFNEEFLQSADFVQPPPNRNTA